jgi:hypothetical protein
MGHWDQKNLSFSMKISIQKGRFFWGTFFSKKKVPKDELRIKKPP